MILDIPNLSATTYSLLAILLSICVYILWFYKDAYSYWKKRGLEYVEPMIPFGNTFSLFMKKTSMGMMFAKSYLHFKEKGLKHGGFYFFWKPIYVPVDPEIIKRVLISDFENFPNHGFHISESEPMSGHIMNMENAKWRSLRAKYPAAFTSAKMRKMFVIMEKMTKQLIENLEPHAVSGKSLDIKNELSRFTTDVISSCAFGLDTKTMKRENEELLKRGRHFFDDQWNVYTNTLVFTVPRYILKKFNFRLMPKEFETYFQDMFREVLNYRKGKQLNRGDIADVLVRLTEKREDEHDFTGKKPMDPLNFEEFAAQAVIFFSAGFETSSSTQTFALYELSKNPECQEKLRDEINEVLAKYDNKITYDAVMDMKYLDKVIDETLRLYPVFPILPRVALNDYKVPGTDFTIEKNTLVLVSNMGIQRDPEYYPNPDQFDPERFSVENKSNRPFVAHIPFGEGPRICVGKRFGLLQTKVGLISMLKRYRVSLSEKTTPSFKFVPHELMLRKTGDIWIDLKKIST
uniref:Cytochrome P450 n=1 Tax=Anoplophora glabripennis TaxID=217634 RepID=A0A8F8MYZ3_ANOGL|nr:cytochrome P450 [Anoplophora glabripennis]